MGISLLIYVSQVGLELQFHVRVYGRYIEVENFFWPVQWTCLLHGFALEFHGDHIWEVPTTALLIMGNMWVINQCT